MPNKLTLLVAGLLLQATSAQAQTNSIAMKVFTFDSVELSFPTISPDEKWLVFTEYRGSGSRLMIRPLTGGPLRELRIPIGWHDRARFTPAGDRLVFVSSLPARDTTDEFAYLVSAPFDTRTGTLSAHPRQISLDGVRLWGGRVVPVISPDGKSVAYVAEGSNAIKLIPVTGGTTKTLVDPPGLPESMAWSADGQFLTYVVRDGKELLRMRVNRDGGAPIVLASLTGSGPLSPDGQGSFTMPWQAPTLHWFTASGQLLGEISLPQYRRPWTLSFAAGGKYIVGATAEWERSVRMVPVAGGPIRYMNYHPGEWLRGWNATGKLVRLWTEKRGDTTQALYSLDGELKWQIPVPDDADLRYRVRVWEGHLVYWAGDSSTSWRLMTLNLQDSTRKEFARNVVPGAFFSYARNTAAPAQFYYWQVAGERAQLRAMRRNGSSRLVAEIPKRHANDAGVFHDRIAYQEWDKDSVRVELVAGAGRSPKTLATFKSDSDVELAWSYDGRLAVMASYPRTLLIYRFDSDGNVQGLPQSVVLPFGLDWSPIRWLPDGSGLTMLAHTRGTSGNEVALVRLADPQHPILLTSGDPVYKSAYQLSPDGKFVLYQSSPIKESSIFVIDVAQMQKEMRKQTPKPLPKQKNK